MVFIMGKWWKTYWRKVGNLILRNLFGARHFVLLLTHDHFGFSVLSKIAFFTSKFRFGELNLHIYACWVQFSWFWPPFYWKNAKNQNFENFQKFPIQSAGPHLGNAAAGARRRRYIWPLIIVWGVFQDFKWEGQWTCLLKGPGHVLIFSKYLWIFSGHILNIFWTCCQYVPDMFLIFSGPKNAYKYIRNVYVYVFLYIYIYICFSFFLQKDPGKNRVASLHPHFVDMYKILFLCDSKWFLYVRKMSRKYFKNMSRTYF